MIVCDGISKTYKAENAIRVLDDVSLVIAAGDMCALTGASGSGKTTLMNMIGLLDRPSAGSITIDGEPVALLSDEALSAIRSRTLGFVFQSFHLLNHLTALDNVALPLVYRGMAAEQRLAEARVALTTVGLENRMAHRPNALSGGQKQRVAIARALVGKPKILLADEPTGNLDSLSARDILDLFCRLNIELGLTTVIVTHDPSIAARCARRIHLQDGRITHREVQ